MNRRQAHTTRHAPTGRDEAPEVPCADRWDVYDVLIDQRGGTGFRSALREARTICGRCPLMSTCLRQNRGEVWAQIILDVRKPTVHRDACGTAAGADAHYKRREQLCEPCQTAAAAKRRERKRRATELAAAKERAAAAAERDRLPGIPDDIRAMHATFVRLGKRGEDIPPSVRDGERTYQALRHQARRARKVAA